MLSTALHPPYQTMQGDILAGRSVAILSCVFAQTGQDYDINVLPWVRVVQSFKQGTSDAIFTAAETQELNSFATMSSPLALEKWYWFINTGTDIKNIRRLRIAAIRGSNEVEWLQANNYPVTIVVNDLQQMVYLLSSRRVDAFLFDKQAVENSLRKLDLAEDRFESVFSGYRPLGIYFSHRFLDERPSFLSDFNRLVSDCMPRPMMLDLAEKNRLRSWLETSVLPQLPMSEIQQQLHEANRQQRGWSAEDIRKQDQRWIQAMNPDSDGKQSKDARQSKDVEQGRQLINRISSRSLSAKLINVHQSTQQWIGEIFITSAKGLSVAHSQPTSDYNHADEEPFYAAVKDDDGFYLGPIAYDESTHQFQVKAAVRIGTKDQPEGVIFIGIDVEQALRVTH